MSNEVVISAPPLLQHVEPIVWIMNLTGRLFVAWCMCLLLAGSVLATDDKAAQMLVAPQVTTDTREYCNKLRDRVSMLIHEARTPPSTEVFDLSVEGQRMCDHGQPRGGIQRLRRALMLMHQHDAPR